MKQWTQIVVLAASLSSVAVAKDLQEQAKKINALYAQGVQAVKVGEIAKARKAFTKVLELHPTHGHARYQLSQLEAKYKNLLLKNRKELFQKTLIKQLDVEEAPLSEVLETLQFLSLEATKKEFSPNFIIQDSTGALKNAPVTLRLNNVPLQVALRYALEQVAAGARYDLHGTIVRPLARAKQ